MNPYDGRRERGSLMKFVVEHTKIARVEDLFFFFCEVKKVEVFVYQWPLLGNNLHSVH